ncbi:MAG TPA: ATP-binding cassette domain-containing protein [Candidatus Hydrogenedentes bacterium]|nr:ATP-binding cassette domain-containing protein [Candidatus Hydrogenedentota bacterium]HPG69908.1 ATP-binding cassette domain-containing protein [Candidatus Hydrogenedentota bacterium]
MIKAKKLTMHYGPVVALNNVSFEVRQGEIVGLLGPNGAGKSTTMKILTTYLHPTQGTAEVGGFDVLEQPLKVRQVIGYLPEILPLYMDMEVKTYLEFVGKARGLSGAKLRQRIELILDECGLRPMYRRIIRELSKGFKQRTGLAQALLHDPQIIILDEPTSGLDPHQIVEIRTLIRRLAENRTVILSTHILQEVQATADRIVIINEGRIVGDGTIEELRDRAKRYERTLVSVLAEPAEAQRLLSGLSGVRNVVSLGQKGTYASFELHGAIKSEVWREVSQLAQTKHWELRELTDKPLTLEETFLTLTEKTSGAQTKEENVA